MRLDVYMQNHGLASSREAAKKLIAQGFVSVNGKTAVKPSLDIKDSDSVAVNGEMKYVGRGGYKLEKLILETGTDLGGVVCADIGASTGGFTDCMLQNGAEKVYAVDVGHNQLAKKLCEDSRVISIEGMNVRDMNEGSLPQKVSFVSVDISFISLKLAIKPILSFLDESGKIAVLIKPQFEVGRENIGKGGIVKSQKAHIRMLYDMLFFFNSCGLYVQWFSFSKIKGGDGNIEYVALLSRTNTAKSFDIEKTVSQAFDEL